MSLHAQDLLTPLLDGRRAGQVVLRPGQVRAGWRAYGGVRNGVLVADVDTAADGDGQWGEVLHVRTGPHGSTGQPGVPYNFRIHTVRHLLHPTVHASFRIEGWADDGTGHRSFANLGFKLSLSHQDNLTAYHLQYKLDGSVVLFKEARDGMEDPANRLPGGGVRLDPVDGSAPRWSPRLAAEQPVRHHLVAGVDADGVVARMDDGPLVRWEDPFLVASGQLSVRLDGVDASLHSLLVS